MELFNPTADTIDLSGWEIWDFNPGKRVKTFAEGTTLGPKEYLIVAGNPETFIEIYGEPQGQLTGVDEGITDWFMQIGDAVYLNDASGTTVDAMSYGACRNVMSPSVRPVASGSGQTLARVPVDQDTGKASDWVSGATATPWDGKETEGMRAGDEIVWKIGLEADCEAVGATVSAGASFNAGTEEEGELFLTVNRPDLVVTKTPKITDASLWDEIEWTVTVKNEGFGTAQNVELWDTLGPGLTFVSFSEALTSQSTNEAGETEARWDVGSLGEGESMSVTVRAQVTSCGGLYNAADAKWGCKGLSTFGDLECENTSVAPVQTATAGLNFIPKHPMVMAWVEDAEQEVPYCGAGTVLLVVSNMFGPDAGKAVNVRLHPTLPSGWSMAGASTNGDVLLDDLEPGEGRTVELHPVVGGTCPIDTDRSYLLQFQPFFDDECGEPYATKLVDMQVDIVELPEVSISKTLTPNSLNTTMGPGQSAAAITVAYTNLSGTETITFSDNYPANMSVSGITGGGVLDEGAKRITWNLTGLSGSGVATVEFMLTAGECSSFQGYNILAFDTFADCHGCSRPILGVRRTPFSVGSSCGTNPCSLWMTMDLSTNYAEVCQEVVVSNKVRGFSGSASNWLSAAGGTATFNVQGINALEEDEARPGEVTDCQIFLNGMDITAESNHVSIVKGAGNATMQVTLTDCYDLTLGIDPSLCELVILSSVSMADPGDFTVETYFRAGCGDWEAREVRVGRSALQLALLPITDASP